MQQSLPVSVHCLSSGLNALVLAQHCTHRWMLQAAYARAKHPPCVRATHCLCWRSTPSGSWCTDTTPCILAAQRTTWSGMSGPHALRSRS